MEADYLVVGAGAMGMAFTDVLMTETDATVVLVDRHHQPGGHWNDAYPFVRLHQPSAFYGVNSRRLGNDTIDQCGWNKGLYELATNGEVCAYFDQVMREQFLASGRVRFLSMCDYRGDGAVTSLWTDETFEVDAGRTVDATYMNVTVPSMRPPPFELDPAVTCVPLNALPGLPRSRSRYVVVGAGKTGMDACLFLLAHGVDPARISWIVPRDAWLLDRASIQALDLFEDAMLQWFSETFGAIAEAESVTDMFARIEARGQLMRLDPKIEPTMYRCATVTRPELEQLRRIEHVVRLGRVRAIERDRVVLDDGELRSDPDTLFIDCTADGLERRPLRPVFDGRSITLQSLRTCQQVFSAAFIGHVEAAYTNEAVKNALCTPVPHPDSADDFMRNILADLANAACWSDDEALSRWLNDSRLDGFTRPGKPTAREQEIRELIAERGAAAAEKLQGFLAAES